VKFSKCVLFAIIFFSKALVYSSTQLELTRVPLPHEKRAPWSTIKITIQKDFFLEHIFRNNDLLKAEVVDWRAGLVRLINFETKSFVEVKSADFFGRGRMAGGEIKTEMISHGRKKIGAFECESFSLIFKGKIAKEFCLSPPEQVGLSPRDLDFFLKEGWAYTRPQDKSPWFAVEVRMFQNGIISGEVTSLTKVERNKPDLRKSEFQAPSGFSRVNIPAARFR
jgi:hypothetical protein